MKTKNYEQWINSIVNNNVKIIVEDKINLNNNVCIICRLNCLKKGVVVHSEIFYILENQTTKEFNVFVHDPENDNDTSLFCDDCTDMVLLSFAKDKKVHFILNEMIVVWDLYYDVYGTYRVSPDKVLDGYDLNLNEF